MSSKPALPTAPWELPAKTPYPCHNALQEHWLQLAGELSEPEPHDRLQSKRHRKLSHSGLSWKVSVWNTTDY